MVSNSIFQWRKGVFMKPFLEGFYFPKFENVNLLAAYA